MKITLAKIWPQNEPLSMNLNTKKKKWIQCFVSFCDRKNTWLGACQILFGIWKSFFFRGNFTIEKIKENALKIVLKWSRSIDPKRWLFEIENAEEAVEKRPNLKKKATVWKRWEYCISDLFLSFPQRMLAGKENYREFLQTKAKSTYKKNV